MTNSCMTVWVAVLWIYPKQLLSWLWWQFHNHHQHIITIMKKTELQISNFQHFHWFVDRLSVHIPALPNMVKERATLKRTENIFAALRKYGRQKPFWSGIGRGKNQCFTRQYYPWEHQKSLQFLIKQLFYSGLLDIKWLWPTWRYALRWISITSYPEHVRRVIVNGRGKVFFRLKPWKNKEVVMCP